MAMTQQAPQGGLAQAAPRPAAPAQQPKENLAARAAGMEQEQAEQPQDYFTKSLEDLRKQRESLNSQIASLKSSLDTRMGLPFDPTLMAAASGFLKPTKTGSFGESLGYASEGMASAAEKEWARQQAVSKLKLELDEKALALKTKGLESEDLLRMTGMGGQAPGAPAMPTPPGGVPSAPSGGGLPMAGAAPSAAAAPAAPGAVGQSGAPNQMRLISDSDITRAYAISKEYGDKISNIAKLQREDIISTPQGPFSRSQQKYLDAKPTQTQSIERDFGRYIGTKKVTMAQSDEYDRVHKEAMEKNDPNIEFNWFKRQGWMEGAPVPTKAEVAAGKTTEGKPEEGGEPLTVEDRKRRDELRQKRAEADIAEEKDAISKIRTGATKARELNNTAQDMIAFAKSNPRAFELLQNTTIKDAILRAAEKGITTPGGSIAFPARELESYKLNPADREALQMFMQAYAKQTVAFRKEARAPGEGATTEAEGLLFSQLGALPSDTARVVIMKSEALQYKAEYDRQLLRTWNQWRKQNPDGTYNEFLDSDTKNSLDDSYDKKLNQMRERNTDILGTAKVPQKDGKPAAPTATKDKETAPAGKQPPRITGDNDPKYINLKPGELYIAPDGTVKRKK